MNASKPTRRRQKLADLIAEDIKRWIVMEDLAPGDRLPNEKTLMEHYECAKGTLREGYVPVACWRATLKGERPLR